MAHVAASLRWKEEREVGCLRDLPLVVVGRCTVSFHGGPFFIFLSLNYDGWTVVMLPAAHSKLAIV